MKKFIYTTAFIGALAGGPALAGEATYHSPPSPGYRTTSTSMHSETTSRRIAATEPAAGDSRYENDFLGPYIGADIGYNFGNAEVDNPGGTDGDVGMDGEEGGVFAGWGWSNPGSDLAGYIGTELGYEWSGADGDIGGVGFEKNDAFKATLKPGMLINRDALAYGIIGYSRAEFEGAGDDENLDGMIFGAGTEIPTGMRVNLRAEYTYTNYEDTNLGGMSFEPHDSAFKIGAVARF